MARGATDAGSAVMARRERARAIAGLVSAELAAFRTLRSASDPSAAWHALERAHILSQLDLGQHLRVHAAMLGFAMRRGDLRESAGQIFRLMLAPLGELTGRTPAGNTGRSDVSAFAPMAIPADLSEQIERLS